MRTPGFMDTNGISIAQQCSSSQEPVLGAFRLLKMIAKMVQCFKSRCLHCNAWYFLYVWGKNILLDLPYDQLKFQVVILRENESLRKRNTFDNLEVWNLHIWRQMSVGMESGGKPEEL